MFWQPTSPPKSEAAMMQRCELEATYAMAWARNIWADTLG